MKHKKGHVQKDTMGLGMGWSFHRGHNAADNKGYQSLYSGGNDGPCLYPAMSASDSGMVVSLGHENSSHAVKHRKGHFCKFYTKDGAGNYALRGTREQMEGQLSQVPKLVSRIKATMKAITITALLCIAAYSTKSSKAHGEYTYKDYSNREEGTDKVKQAINAFHNSMIVSERNERLFKQQNRANH